MTYRVGVDIGSTAAKVVVLDGDELVFTLLEPTGYSSVDAAERIEAALVQAGFPLEECDVVATGYGRVSVPYARKAVTEITCHGRGAAFLFGPDGVVVDIGGQDTKAIVLERGRVAKFNMNDKCSAGTGKFLEIMANRMGVTQVQLEQLARRGHPTQISSMCTVFAESEVISLIGAGTPREDIAWGVIESVAAKVRPLVPSVAGARHFLTGGLCENDYLVERLSAQLDAKVETCPQARFAGAIGAALSVPLASAE
ncbi:acyl-CoA dehydratase activase [Adlercreutzia sp. ZJ473]|uniref:acyl-CoA dehydratase activase n=1 Tax=Adlercreutzia sp. ZJ473 TaxID=2722822 RepID=UPI0015522E6F|nr:acyl-CoA dehydratase activase [Adlercreutzia sp. ZJ473]